MSLNIMGADGHWLTHRAVSTGASAPGLVANWICRYAVRLQCKAIVVAFDGPEVFRYDRFPEYKANRVKNARGEPGDAVAAGSGCTREDIEATMNYLGMLGIPVIMRRKYEADDLLCSVAALGSPTVKVAVVTNDKDSFQFIGEHVSLYRPALGKTGVERFMRLPDLHRLTGFTPAQYLDYQTLIGDKIDNIPSLMTPAAAKAAVMGKGGLKAWLKGAAGAEWAADKIEALNLNRVLVKLSVTALPADFSFTVEEPKIKAPIARLELGAYIKKRSLFG